MTSVKPGFIFIQDEHPDLPLSYRAFHAGGAGYFSQLDPDSINGHTPVTLLDYKNTDTSNCCITIPE